MRRKDDPVELLKSIVDANEFVKFDEKYRNYRIQKFFAEYLQFRLSQKDIDTEKKYTDMRLTGIISTEDSSRPRSAITRAETLRICSSRLNETKAKACLNSTGKEC